MSSVWRTARVGDVERLRAVERALQRLATGDPPLDVPGTLRDLGVHPDDAREIGALSPERLGVYRSLVFGTVKGTLSSQTPRTASRLEEARALDALVGAFLREGAPRARYLRDVPFEIVAWADGGWRRPASVPPTWAEIARFELLTFAAGNALRGPRPERAAPLALERGVWLDGSVHLARFDHAVHLLPDDPGDRAEPERRPSFVLSYRDADNEARVIELSELAMAILSRLAEGAPLGASIEGACRERRVELQRSVTDGASLVLSDLADRGVLLGAAPEPGGARLPAREELSPHWRWLLDGRASP
jgi:hypothetical protein